MKLSVRDMILVSMFAALTAVGAFIKIPLKPVPVTLQFFFSAFAGIILGSKKGALSQIIYIAVGLVGFPIFAEGGGLAYIFKPTFGYLLGFAFNAYVIGRLTEHYKKVNTFNLYAAVLSGLMLVYVIGVSYLYTIVNFHMVRSMSFVSAIKKGMLPFLAKDMIIGLIVTIVAVTIMPRLNKALRLGKDNFSRC